MSTIPLNKLLRLQTRLVYRGCCTMLELRPSMWCHHTPPASPELQPATAGDMPSDQQLVLLHNATDLWFATCCGFILLLMTIAADCCSLTCLLGMTAGVLHPCSTPCQHDERCKKQICRLPLLNAHTLGPQSTAEAGDVLGMIKSCLSILC